MNISRNVGRAFAAEIGSLVLLATPGIVYGAPGDTELVSVSASGAAVDGSFPTISADGRFVAFLAQGKDIAPGAASEFEEVFVRDLLTGTTERVTVGLAGQPANKVSDYPAISANGRYVVFSSVASNLVPNDTDGETDIFVRDRTTKQTVQVNVGPGGGQISVYYYPPAISADGRYVSFTSQPRSGVGDVYVKDLQTGLLEKVSVGPNGQQANGESLASALSGDGLYVAFSSEASNLVSGDTNGHMDIFVRDRLTSQTTRFISAPGSPPANGESAWPSLNTDGRYVAFVSTASNLVPGDTNGQMDVFVWDRPTGSVERVSVTSNGAQARDWSYVPSISADGRYVAFASGLVPGTNGHQGVFVRDRATGLTELASVASDGTQADSSSLSPAISADGRFVVFASYASNLVPNGGCDCYAPVFIHELGGSTTPPTFGFALKPTARAYGNQALYTSTMMSFSLINTGTAALPITSVSIFGLNPGMFSVNNRCGTSVAVGASCSFQVTFRPTSVGDKSAKLRVVAGDNDVRTKALSGKGIRSPFTVSPTSLDFGSVPIGTTTAAKVVTISNTGGAVLPISSIALGGWNPYQFAQTHNCPANLAVGATCRISVVFKPTKEGSKAALVQITPGGGSGALRSVALAGAARR